METFSLLLSGLENALTLQNIFFCFLGVTIGMFVGVLPGLGPVTTTALLIPITFGMDPAAAIIMISGVFYGAMYGGTITSVLINVPGEAASVVTAIDGYQMAKQGRAGTALGVAAIGSFIGGIAAIILLAFVGPPLARLALKFGPPEYFAMLLFGLLMVVALMGESVVKGLIAVIFGLLLSLIGMDPVSGEIRFHFGQIELYEGIDFVVLAMGMFGISEILISLENRNDLKEPAKIKKLLPERGEWGPSFKAIGRGTSVGLFLGLIPGSNSIISSIISYALEKKIAKDPSRFGKGAIEGVAGPETANNAHIGSALIPLFTLGLPTSAAVAMLFSAFIIHGLTPGPKLFEQNSLLVWTIIASMFIGNIILLIFNLPMARLWAKVTLVPYKLLFPLIVVIILLGTYSINNSLWDVFMTIFFGVIGYFLKKMNIPIAATLLTFVLGSQIEMSLFQSLSISQNGLLIFFQRPISMAFLSIAIIAVIISAVSGMRKKKTILEGDMEV
jgi:putative tricarboxylic transport membrane protein